MSSTSFFHPHNNVSNIEDRKFSLVYTIHLLIPFHCLCQVVALGFCHLHFLQHIWLTCPNRISPCRYSCTTRSSFSPLECILCSSHSWRRLFPMDDPRHSSHRRWCRPHSGIWNRARTYTLSRGSSRTVQQACICCLLLSTWRSRGRLSRPCMSHPNKNDLADANHTSTDTHSRLLPIS